MDKMIHEAELNNTGVIRKYEDKRQEVFVSKAIMTEKECPFSGFASANALGPVGKRTCHQGHCLIVDNNRVVRAQIPGTRILEHQQDQMIHAALNFR